MTTTVHAIIREADPAKVAEAYNRFFNEGQSANEDGVIGDGWGRTEVFERFRSLLELSEGYLESDPLTMHMELVTDDPLADNKPYYRVFLKTTASDLEYSALGVEWEKIKDIPFEADEGAAALDCSEKAAHIFHEMTWFGWLNERLRSVPIL